MKKMLLFVAVAAVLAAAAATFTASDAKASSMWCSPFNVASGSVFGWHCSLVSGSGTWVSSIKADFGTYSPRQVCNWNTLVQYWDPYGYYEPWLTVWTGVRNWCSSAATDYITVNSWRTSGTLVCVTLQSYGSRVTSECHRIQ
jgi:hypothetical protein